MSSMVKKKKKAYPILPKESKQSAKQWFIEKKHINQLWHSLGLQI